MRIINKLIWEYGTCGNHNRVARKHRLYGNVQFVLWKAGEQNHKKDYWHNFDESWWKTFKNNKQYTINKMEDKKMREGKEFNYYKLSVEGKFEVDKYCNTN